MWGKCCWLDKLATKKGAKMAKDKRYKTAYPGVYYVIKTEIGSNKPEKIFYIRYRKAGKPIEEKAGRAKSDDMTAARAATMRAAKITGKKPANVEKRIEEVQVQQAADNRWTIQRLFDEYAVQKEDNKAFRTDKGRYDLYLKEPFGDKEPSEMLQLDIDQIRVKHLKKKSPQTVKHILSLLKRLIKFGTDRGLCIGTGFAIKLPRVDNRKTEFLTAEEMQRLMEAIKKDKHPQAGNLMLMALYTGMRRGELFKLQWQDIDQENNFITLREPKGGKAQKIPLNERAKQVLQNIKRGKGASFIFPGNLGKQRSNINRAINVIKTAAGLPADFRPLHGLRHTYASMLASSGAVDLYTLQKLLTHKDHRMTERYAHLHDDVLKRAAEVAGDIISQAMNGNKDKVVDMKNKK